MLAQCAPAGVRLDEDAAMPTPAGREHLVEICLRKPDIARPARFFSLCPTAWAGVAPAGKASGAVKRACGA